jgi:hypothetical protein
MEQAVHLAPIRRIFKVSFFTTNAKPVSGRKRKRSGSFTDRGFSAACLFLDKAYLFVHLANQYGSDDAVHVGNQVVEVSRVLVADGLSSDLDRHLGVFF